MRDTKTEITITGALSSMSCDHCIEYNVRIAAATSFPLHSFQSSRGDVNALTIEILAIAKNRGSHSDSLRQFMPALCRLLLSASFVIN